MRSLLFVFVVVFTNLSFSQPSSTAEIDKAMAALASQCAQNPEIQKSYQSPENLVRFRKMNEVLNWLKDYDRDPVAFDGAMKVYLSTSKDCTEYFARYEKLLVPLANAHDELKKVSDLLKPREVKK